MLKIYTLYVNNYDSVHDKIAAFSKRKEFKAFLLVLFIFLICLFNN